MNTKLYSFMEIFQRPVENEQEAIQVKKIIIPIIQRDYAQGRLGAEVGRVRKRFLEALYKAVTEKPIALDFVYGDIDAEGNMIPLDGQQRLTTLFLLHWYAAKKEHIPAEEYAFLRNFTYETRYSARHFCRQLVEYTPYFLGRISHDIIDQAWFPLDWQKDPTISSMLVMLDAIEDRFGDVADLWEKLRDRCITFYFLPIKDMGLTDELYIKMNSRGKPLTLFEHFKAELEGELRGIDDDMAGRIGRKIDCQWTDLLWQYRNSSTDSADDNIIDDEFLRYFKFVCDVICFRQGDSPLARNDDVFDLLQEYFSKDNPNTAENVRGLEEFFDCWCNIPGFDSPTEFLQSFMSHSHQPGKLLIESRYKLNIFEDCLQTYADKTGRNRQFPLNRFVLLYAIIVHLQHSKEIDAADFVRRIRIVNNLIRNSDNEINVRIDRNRMPAILAETEAIIITGKIDDAIENNFNANQLKEEKAKIEYLQKNPHMVDILFKLEDHALLYGQISILGLENLAYTDRFISLFDCNLDKVDCAMMSVGNYGQREQNSWRYQYGSTRDTAWRELFHKSRNEGFENTSSILINLLQRTENFSDDILQGIIDDYLAKCENASRFAWRYYYVKYPQYRPGRFGKLGNYHADDQPYLFSVMQTQRQWSENTYLPFLKAADEVHLSRDHMGQRLTYENFYIICTNDSYLVVDNESEEVMDTISISQDEKGIDTKDRISVLKGYLSTRRQG